MNFLKKLVPQYAVVPLLAAAFMHMFAYDAPKLLAANAYHYNLETALDMAIPLIPWTIVIYFGCFAVWVVSILLCVRFDERRAYRFLCADLISKIVCLIFFLAFPTTNTRPELGEGFWNSCMRFLYLIDSPDNLFPSMHCLMSWLCWLGIRQERSLPRWFRVFSLVSALAVFVATLTTKQHILYDVLSGCLLAEVSYWLAGKKPIITAYCRLFHREPPTA